MATAGQVTSGATSDLKQATSTARHMVADCGMSDAIGPVYVASNAGPYREASEDSQQRVEAEVRVMLMDAYQRVKTLLVRPSSQTKHQNQSLVNICE